VADLIRMPGPIDKVQVVLIVEDEPVLRSVVGEHLRACGFYPFTVRNAEEAVRMISVGVDVDIVFSDVRMPGAMDGWGLARWIAEHRPDLPILLTSEDVSNATVRLCKVETIAKPYDFDVAAQKLHDTIHRHRLHRT
jgi:CheY-like chemotaxis protein